jgi:hypothetical protein
MVPDRTARGMLGPWRRIEQRSRSIPRSPTPSPPGGRWWRSRLETLGVAVLGFGTRRFPGFYLTDSGHELDWQVGDPGAVAAVMAARRALGSDRGALVVANPLPPDEQVDPALHDRLLAEGPDVRPRRRACGASR